MSFDSYAEDYDDALNEGLRATGESKDYFARTRVSYSQELLAAQGVFAGSVQTILDYGCGVGDTAPILKEAFPKAAVLGVDASPHCIERAQETLADDGLHFETINSWQPAETVDVAYCNGVFHHIVPSERDVALKMIYKALKPGGYFAFWENNPLNLGTQYVMWKIPFDRDAIKILPHHAKALLDKNSFEVVCTRFLFLFPSLLKRLRPLERVLASYPLGAQYLVLVRKPI